MDASLGELAVRFGCALRGDPAVRVNGVGTLAGAGPGQVAFLANPLYRPQLAATRASAVLVSEADAAACPVAALVSSNPYAAYARIATLLYPEPPVAPGVHPAASVDPTARVAPDACVGPGAVVGAHAVVGARCRVGPGCVLGEGVQLGADCVLVARATVIGGARLGERVRVHPGAVIGSDGFGFARDGAAWVKVPQVGSVRIGDDVEIGANTAIDRGALGDTVIGDGAKIDNLVQVGHNVSIGEHTAIAGCVGISGSTRIGARCMIGGAVGIVGHLDICDDVAITGLSMVSASIGRPGVYSGGIPAEEARLWRRLVARFKRGDALAARVLRLERKLGGEGARDEADD